VKHYKAVLDNNIYLGDGSLKFIVGYQQNRRQEFEDPLQPNEPGLDFVLHTINYDLHYLSPEFSGWKLAAGINGMWQQSLNKGDEYLIPAYHLFDIGFFATASRTFRKLSVSGGLRYDNRNLKSDELKDRFTAFTRHFNGVTGSIGAIYNVSEAMNIRMNISRGFRAPNMSELGSNGVHEGTIRYELGNSQLKPEYSLQFDLGLDYSSAIFSAQLSLFANKIDNFIFAHRLQDTQMEEGYATFKFTSGDARLLGGEASVDIHPIERIHFQNTFSYVDAVQLHQHRDTKYLPFSPAPRWTSDLRYDIIRDGKTLDNTYVAMGLECYLRQNHFYEADNTETATPSYTLLNLSAGTDLKIKGRKVASLFLTANNITDRAYQSHLSRLKYTAINNSTGRMGVFNMGRNFGIKIVIPILSTNR
jgi:iron complex outermembrane receptor protein